MKRFPFLALACASLLVSPAARASDDPAPEGAAEVRVERVRPAKDKLSTLRFLKENKAFIRARYDLLRQRQLEHRGDASAIDPRFLDYQRMLSGVLAAGDSVSAAGDLRERQQLLASINDLGQIESRLDQMERLLAEQRGRLGILQEDFTGHQKTALLMVLRGHSAAGTPERIQVRLDDGDTVSVALAPEQRQSLEQGGVVQIFHGFVEPREQVFEVALAGGGFVSNEPGFLTLEPQRDRLTFLELDLSSLAAGQGPGGIRARAWLRDSGLPRGDH